MQEPAIGERLTAWEVDYTVIERRFQHEFDVQPGRLRFYIDFNFAEHAGPV